MNPLKIVLQLQQKQFFLVYLSYVRFVNQKVKIYHIVPFNNFISRICSDFIAPNPSKRVGSCNYLCFITCFV